MKKLLVALTSAFLICAATANASELTDSVKQDYDDYLSDLWIHLHENPELSLAEAQRGGEGVALGVVLGRR